MRALFAAVLAVAALPAAADDYLRSRPAPAPGHSYPAPYCVNRGVRVEVGETTCIVRNCCPDKGCEVFTAQCAMSTNVTTFRKVQEGCQPEQISRAPLSEPTRPPSAPPGRG
jgi:hypothetical protein